MYILDVISGVSRSSKCTKIVGGWGFAPDTTGGADSAPRLLAGFKGAYFKAPTSKGSGSTGRGRRGAPKLSMPRAPKKLAPQLLVRGKAGGPRTLVYGKGAQFEITPLLESRSFH